MELRPVHLVAFAGFNAVSVVVGIWFGGNWKLCAIALVVMGAAAALAFYFARRVKKGADQAISDGIASASKEPPLSPGTATDEANGQNDVDDKGPQAELPNRLKLAVCTLRDSHLGESRGAAALYDLPWYMLIGHS